MAVVGVRGVGIGRWGDGEEGKADRRHVVLPQLLAAVGVGGVGMVLREGDGEQEGD